MPPASACLERRAGAALLGWGLGVGHLVPVLMVTQGLTQLATLALGLAALGVCLCERGAAAASARDSVASANGSGVHDRDDDFP